MQPSLDWRDSGGSLGAAEDVLSLESLGVYMIRSSFDETVYITAHANP